MSRPYGFTLNGHVGTDDGSPWNAIETRNNEVMHSMQDIIANVDETSNVEILKTLRKAANMMSKQDKTNYWMSDKG